MGWLKKALGGHKDGLSKEISRCLQAGSAIDIAQLAYDYEVGDEKARAILVDLATPVIVAKLDKAADEGAFSPEIPRQFGAACGLTDEQSKEIGAAWRTGKVRGMINDVLSDGILNPDEDEALAKVLTVFDATLDDDVEAALSQARSLWYAGNGPLLTIDSPILLRAGEVCHYVTQAEATEDRSRTVRVGYGGVSARVKIIKGVYYNTGSFQARRETEAYEHSFGTGILCMTNKRLLWVSPLKSVSIGIGKVVRYDLFSNGIKIFKDTGKPMMFYWPAPNRVASTYAARIIEELR